jgi:hypothetical protein
MWGTPKKFAVVLTCADWRLHHPRAGLYRQTCRALGVDGLFMDAVPGPDGLLNQGRETDWAAVVRWTKLLADTRAPQALAIVAHQNCIAHPVSDGQHEADVRRVAECLKRELNFTGPMLALVAARHSDAKWRLKQVAEY